MKKPTLAALAAAVSTLQTIATALQSTASNLAQATDNYRREHAPKAYTAKPVLAKVLPGELEEFCAINDRVDAATAALAQMTVNYQKESAEIQRAYRRWWEVARSRYQKLEAGKNYEVNLVTGSITELG